MNQDNKKLNQGNTGKNSDSNSTKNSDPNKKQNTNVENPKKGVTPSTTEVETDSTPVPDQDDSDLAE